MKNRIFALLQKLKGSSPDNEYSQIQSALTHGEPLQICRKHLVLLLDHASQNVPFYGTALPSHSAGGHVDLDLFHRLPILTKGDIKRHQKELTSKDINARKWHYTTTGGSTGEPLKLIQDGIFDRWAGVTTKYYYQNIVRIDELGVKKVLLWGSDREIYEHTIGLRAKIVNWLTNTTFLNSYRMTKVDMERFVKTINKCRPDLIRGYAGSLYELSRYIAIKQIPIHSPSVVVSTAEKLDAHRRQTIEWVFGTKVYDFYGSREVDGIAGQCPHGLMHLFTFNNYVEVLMGHGSFRASEMGRVVVSNLHNYSMPLIRYDIGDTAIPGPAKCSCGDPLPTWADMTGRVTDHFLTDDGTIVNGLYFTTLFFQSKRDWVKSFQVVQEDFKRVRILVVVEDANRSEMQEISEKVRLVMGRDCGVIWDIVDEIPKTEGKHLWIKSLVSR